MKLKLAHLCFKNRLVTQIHWGGGTPTYLDEDQSARLMQMLRANFDVSDDAEISIEMDPREIELAHVGSPVRAIVVFNRLSMGIQDFDKEVQRLVNREQDEEFIFALMKRAKELGFVSTNVI